MDPAERNMDTSVKMMKRTASAGAQPLREENELHRVEANQTQAVKGGTEILTGKASWMRR